MLWTIAVILVVLWFLGIVTSYTMGGLIHILLVVAIVVVVLNLISGKRTLQPTNVVLLKESSDAWDDVKVGTEKTWSELSDSIKKAVSRFK